MLGAEQDALELGIKNNPLVSGLAANWTNQQIHDAAIATLCFPAAMVDNMREATEVVEYLETHVRRKNDGI